MRFRSRTSGSVSQQRSYSYYSYCTGPRYGPTWPANPLATFHEVCWDELHSGPPYKTGGPLNLWRMSIGNPWGSDYKSDFNTYSNCLYNPYRGTGHFGVIPPYTDPSFWPYWLDDDWGNASSYGAAGWNKYRPAQPAVELGQDIAELRDTFRDLFKRARSFKDLYDGRRKLPTNPASNFLEWNFGWQPLIRDIEKSIKQYQTLDETIDRIKRMNGRWDHRGGPVDSQNESEATTYTGNAALARCVPLGTSTFPTSLLNRCTVTDTMQYTSKAWFEGSFRYYIPDINTPEWADKARRKLMGLNVNPALVWELVPWSWLADWISNAGDVFSNMDNGLAENLVAAYAYIMRTTTCTFSRNASIVIATLANPLKEASLTHAISTKFERKHRVAASPFGFGIDFGSFSPKQIAIMAALGLSRT